MLGVALLVALLGRELAAGLIGGGGVTLLAAVFVCGRYMPASLFGGRNRSTP
jgi:hypothetical protein